MRQQNNVNHQCQQTATNRNVNSSHLSMVKPISYVHAVNQNLTSAVQTAEAENIKKQQIDDNYKESTIIYGYPATENDYEDLLNLLSNLRCNILILRFTRLG